MKRERDISVAILVIALVALAGSCARPVPPAVRRERPAPPTARERIKGILKPQGIDVPLAGATVTAGGRVAAVRQDGSFGFDDLPPGKNNLVVEKTFQSGAVRRVMGVATIYVADNPVEIAIPVRDATDIDAFCLDCHPYKGRKTRRDQIVRCIHVSGVVAGKANKPGAPLDPAGKVTCESCHAIHRDTGTPHYVLTSYVDGKLCNQCH